MKKGEIFFVTLPKSGTDFTWNTLVKITKLKFPGFMNAKTLNKIQTGYYPVTKNFHSVGDFDSQIMNVRGTKKYVNKGYVFGTHMAASHYNMTVLAKSGVKKVTVIIRNPLDAVISWTYHLERAGEHIRNYNSLFQFLPSGYFKWSHTDKLSFNLRTFLPTAVNWVESWLGVFEKYKDIIDMQIMYFDHMRSDNKSYFNKILTFHNVSDFDLNKIPEKKSLHHYRKGTNDQWIEEYSESDKMLAELLIGSRIDKAFQNAIENHPQHIDGLMYEKSGDKKSALKSFVQAFSQFPTAAIIEKIISINTDLGYFDNNELLSLADKFAKELNGNFLFPVELIDLLKGN